MPYVLDANGIQIATQQELVQFLTGFYMSIYGQQIDLSSSSQDGQMMQIYVQAQLDVSGIVLSDYNSRDLNSAVGTQLDNLVWWLPRKGGTFTVYAITVVSSGPGTLYGLDQTVQPVTTIQDASGNQYELLVTTAISGAGSQVLNFEAANPGNITSPANSINVPVTVALFITSYNNASATPVTQGQTAEPDFDYRIRAMASVAIPGQGFFNSLFAAVNNVPQATRIQIYENRGDTISPNSFQPVAGVPAHGIWAVVQGAAKASDIATAIYNQRTLGCNMKGSQTFTIVQDDGSSFVVQWDNVVPQALYIHFTATSIDGINPPNIAAILAQLPTLWFPGVGATININQLIAFVNQIDPNTLVTGAGLSAAALGPFTNTLAPTAANYQFVVTGANTSVLPIVLLPVTSLVNPGSPGGAVQFQAYGGTQIGYVYSFVTNNSGGAINATTGLYHAGNTPDVTDTIKVVDSAINQATATVEVAVL